MILALVLATLAGTGTASHAATPRDVAGLPVVADAASGADLCAQVGDAAGFDPSSTLVTAVAVALAESGCNPQATGTNTDGSRDRGLWQINDRAHPDVSDSCAYDPQCNANAAYAISSHGTNWSPWTTYDSGAYRSHLSEAQAAVDRLGVHGTASVYGVLSDGRLTYTAIDAATGNRTHGAVTSGATLGFTPKAMATLNFNTLLITSTGGRLYRVDIITNNESLEFNTPVPLGDGWTHDLLAFDGTYLYGIAGGALRRYQITSSKPGSANIVNNILIDNGFTLKTLTATGPGWILGTTSDGQLLSYQIRGTGAWSRYQLKSSTWGGLTHLLSPGRGVYYGRTADGAMYRYLDAHPYDGDGSDIAGFPNDPVDTRGWTQSLLSAQPNTVS